MAVQLKLSSKEILEKKFPGTPRGYNPLLVDEYLDEIIKDYLTIENNALLPIEEVDKLKKQNESLKEKVKELEIENGKYKARLANIKESDNVSSDNMDLVKKINKYEKFLFNHGFNPNNIK